MDMNREKYAIHLIATGFCVMNALALRHLHQINLPLRMGDVEQ